MGGILAVDRNESPSFTVAIIGGGVSGAVCAKELSRLGAGRLTVTVFDQGRQLGGRAAHRRVQEDGEYVSSASVAPFAFDHGCQFFRADSPRFREELLREWLDRKWAAEWKGKFGTLQNSSDVSVTKASFFGFPHQPPYYCGVGGMCFLPMALLEDATTTGAVQVRGGVRVANTVKLSDGKWLLSGTSGKAALHDTAEEEAARSAPDALGEFDVVVVTDVSASMAGWHRASAGIPEEVAARVRGRTRVVLFTALFAFERPVNVDLQAMSAADDVLWFAARTRSKPGLDEASTHDCWTFVSTPKYAAAEVERVPMQDPKTGAFRPQEMHYLREGPCAELLAAFAKLLSRSGHDSALPLPKAVYVGGQRWGSSFPAPSNDGRDAKGRGPTTVEVLGVAYDSAASLTLAPADDRCTSEMPEEKKPRPADHENGNAPRDFLADDERRIYYASDYVSGQLPGLEASALSALDAARHIVSKLL
mmetsp:Transcript_105054/g.201647  ORF Transcript_105054/g.201647 Transcript_105054/m.201647 type:complete len:477 (-) Transcript_105054:54-1484(-)